MLPYPVLPSWKISRSRRNPGDFSGIKTFLDKDATFLEGQAAVQGDLDKGDQRPQWWSGVWRLHSRRCWGSWAHPTHRKEGFRWISAALLQWGCREYRAWGTQRWWDQHPTWGIPNKQIKSISCESSAALGQGSRRAVQLHLGDTWNYPEQDPGQLDIGPVLSKGLN